MKITLSSFFHSVFFALQSCKFDVFLKVKQYKILDTVLSGRDVIGVLPTGYGKSIVFQLLPYIYEYLSGRELMVLVVAPLKELIEDQIRYLRGKGINVGALQTKKSSTVNTKPELLILIMNLNPIVKLNVVTMNKTRKIFATMNYRILKTGNLGFFFCTQKGLYHAGKAGKS